MLKSNLDKQGKKLNRNELKGITGGNIRHPFCPQECTYQDHNTPLMLGCPNQMECVPYSCGGPDEYAVHCV